MQSKWLKEIVTEYLTLRDQNYKNVWTSFKNFTSRLLAFSEKRKNAYQSLVNSDIDFSYSIERWLDKQIQKHKVTLPELKKGQRALKNHVSKSAERTLILIGFASIFTVTLVFLKFGVLDFGPYKSILIGFMGFMLILSLHERTEHLKLKHAIEEIQLYLEDRISKLEENV